MSNSVKSNTQNVQVIIIDCVKTSKQAAEHMSDKKVQASSASAVDHPKPDLEKNLEKQERDAAEGKPVIIAKKIPALTGEMRSRSGDIEPGARGGQTKTMGELLEEREASDEGASSSGGSAKKENEPQVGDVQVSSKEAKVVEKVDDSKKPAAAAEKK